MRNELCVFGTVMLAMGQFSFGGAMCSAAAGSQVEAGPASLAGVVLETTNASRYTYVKIDTGADTVWAAGPAFDVKVGDRVVAGEGMITKDFISKSLNRKFDELYMAGSIMRAGSTGAPQGGPVGKMPAGHPPVMGKNTVSAEGMPVIQKPEGGKTVAEIWADKAALSGKPVLLRAKVVKVTPKVLKLNWLHLRDGSGVEGQNDLVVTTTAEVRVGDVITVKGTLATDKDFGSGYKYDVILESAVILAE